MNINYINTHPNESMFIAAVIIFVVWYYYYIYKENKSLTDIFKKKEVPKITVPVVKEEFENNIKDHVYLSEDHLKSKLH